MGHDQLFKQLLRAFCAEFLTLFDPETAARLDLDTLTFQDTEAFTDIPQGERRTADLVAGVRTREGQPEAILVHVEIQRVREVRFPWRMCQYYFVLRQRDDIPVIPIAVVLYPGREGIALEEYVEAVFGRTYLSFRYLQISLPRLDAAAYVQAGGPLGAALAAVMDLPAAREEQVAVYAAAMHRIGVALDTGQVDEARAYLLINLLHTYLPLTDDEQQTVRVQLQQQGDTTVEAIELTWADRLVEQGFEQGREEEREGLRRAILQSAQTRFGQVSPALEQAVQGMKDQDALLAFFSRTLTATDEAALLSNPR